MKNLGSPGLGVESQGQFLCRENKTINQAVTSMNAFSSLAVEEHQPTVSGELFMRPQWAANVLRSDVEEAVHLLSGRDKPSGESHFSVE